MRCHYEVLNVPRDADDATIKSAYRKSALKWHPDKNLDNPEAAKEQFQLVQQAYEILSDRHERAWYDNHREQILRAADKDFEDKSLDVFQYFTTSCFNGYGDDEKGFYTVYRKVFEDIANEDLEFMENKDDFSDIPNFGDSKSDYDTVVRPFYAYWSNYLTKKSYVWLDPYNVTEIRGGKILKLVEKENKKVRQKAKKERNEEVRNLVAFVRKRDKRVAAQNKLEEMRKLENRKKQENISIQRRLERQMELNESGGQAEWAKFDNVKSELEEIEKHLAQEFGETMSDTDDEEIYNNNLYCIACNKLFKKQKAFQSHEHSKKHKDNVERMKQDMGIVSDEVSEEDSQDSEPDQSEVPEDNEGAEINSDHCSENNLNIDANNSDLQVSNDEKCTKKKKNKKRNILRVSEGEREISKEFLEPVVNDSDDEFGSSRQNKRKSTKKNKAKDKSKTNNEHKSHMKKDIEDNGSEQNKENTLNDKSLGFENQDNLEDTQVKNEENVDVKSRKRPGKKNKKSSNENNAEQVDTSLCCVSCKASFPSKNKLFEHLKKTGHSVQLTQNVGKEKSKRKK